METLTPGGREPEGRGLDPDGERRGAAPPPAARPPRPVPGFWQAVAFLVGFWALLGIGGVVAMAALIAAGASPTGDLAVGLTGLLQLAVCLALVGAGRALAGRPLAVLVPLGAVPLRLLAPVAVFSIGAAIVASELDNLLQHLVPAPELVRQAMGELLSGGPGALFTLAVAAPLSEEVLFRGFILDGFRRRYPAGRAIVLSSLLFALAHLNPYQFAIAFGLGLFLAWVVLRTGSLWPAIWAHAATNGFGWVAGNWLPAGIPGFTAVDEIALQPWWLDAGGVALLVLGAVGVRAALPRPPGDRHRGAAPPPDPR